MQAFNRDSGVTKVQNGRRRRRLAAYLGHKSKSRAERTRATLYYTET